MRQKCASSSLGLLYRITCVLTVGRTPAAFGRDEPSHHFEPLKRRLRVRTRRIRKMIMCDGSSIPVHRYTPTRPTPPSPPPARIM